MNRLFVEKRAEFNSEAKHLYHDIRGSLGIDALEAIRVVQRYDLDGLSDEEFTAASRLILSEPQVDHATPDLSLAEDETAYAVEYLPGQFDQRADSAAQCVQILTGKQRPLVASAHLIVLKGTLSPADVQSIKDYTINAVDSREASMEIPASLEIKSPPPADVPHIDRFTEQSPDELAILRAEMGLAMSHEDLLFCQDYFRDQESRNPTITEIRMLDTYWSDHCRHTTFLTRIEEVSFDEGTAAVEQAYNSYRETRNTVYGPDTTRPETLMDIALMGMKELRKSGELHNLEVSEEINAASIVVPVEVDGTEEEWLVMFKNETHNHPTEIEPFGGAATCLGGAIRDPLSGRAYVYQAMRVTGAGDPRTPFPETLPGKLPQRKICQVAAKGYSSYGNQIGLATGKVSEVYHPGYVAKRLEVGAVIAAAPRKNVFRGAPATGDAILLIGGRTGRDGVGGATGSSKEHTDDALDNSAEVQKGDPPTERKIQRLFRNPELAPKIKVCNDFGAGGVSVAIGEIAPSLDIDLDQVLKKYDGLDGTELAISESQERMAVLVDPADIDYFVREADRENLECVLVAKVADHGRLVIRWRGTPIVNLSRAFLDTNGVQLSSRIRVTAPTTDSPLANPLPAVAAADGLQAKWHALLGDLSQCSQKGLGEQFDSSIGAGTVLSPFGGKHQRTPSDAMVAKIPLLEGQTDTATYMSWGFNPRIAQWSPFHGAYFAVTESVCRIVAAGGALPDIRLTFQEYFEKLGTDPARWGKPFAALLGAFRVQHELRLAAIGGKDSMSGSFNDLDVPPTLVSFAVSPGKASRALSPEFKNTASAVYFVELNRDADGLPDLAQLKELAAALHQLNTDGHLRAAHSLGEGGIAAGLATMAFGNGIGFEESESDLCLFRERYGAFLLETPPEAPIATALSGAQRLGSTASATAIKLPGATLSLSDLLPYWTAPLEDTYPTQAPSAHPELETFRSTATPARSRSNHPTSGKPKILIPVFPGTNCEYDTARVFREAGGDPDIFVFRNLDPAAVEESLANLATKIDQSQILMLPGGFSGGDEPDGSGKFIATALRNPRVREATMRLLNDRDGLILGICNGFQALIKTGLLPYGEIRDPEADAPTLTFNDIGRHASCYVTTRVASTLSPWLAHCKVDDLHRIPISHGEGKFYASPETIRALAANGQIATQYTNPTGGPSMDIAHNPNGSLFAVEGLCSPDGRVLGKMAHSERCGPNIARNIPGEKHQPIFKAGVAYFL